jgi:hypothetical protein
LSILGGNRSAGLLDALAALGALGTSRRGGGSRAVEDGRGLPGGYRRFQLWTSIGDGIRGRIEDCWQPGLERSRRGGQPTGCV